MTKKEHDGRTDLFVGDECALIQQFKLQSKQVVLHFFKNEQFKF